MSNTIRIGIIGFGFAAQTFHVPLLRALPEEFEITAVSSSKPEAVHAVLPQARVFSSPQDLLAHPQVDAVVVTAPNTLHYPLSREALAAGKHLIVEKPATITAAESEDLAGAARQTGLVASVFHNRRWDSDFLTLKRLLQEERLGDLSHIELHFDRYRPQVRQRWRESDQPGAGLLYDLGSHLIDQTLQLFGLPRGVTADIRIQRTGGKSDDYVHLMLDYGSFPVIIHITSLCRGPGFRYIVNGTEGSLVKLGLDPQEDQLKQGVRPDSELFGVEDKNQWGTLYLPSDHDSTVTATLRPEKGNYLGFYRDFAGAIRGDNANPVTIDEGAEVIRIIELAQQSAQLGKTIQL